MKQIIQDLKNGNTNLADIPVPLPADGEVLIKTTRSLVSLGTERMLVEFGQANLINKARQQPDRVKMVLDKVKTDGLSSTLQSVRTKLDQPLPLGYSNVGVVVETGKNIRHLKKGDRVISNGFHAEYVSVPENLTAKIPDAVDDDQAVFTVVASIALQGIRLINPTLGETVVVYGLGLIGLLAVKILLANGCRVIGIDIDQEKVSLAASFGAETIVDSRDIDTPNMIEGMTNGIGVDAVLITASAKTNSIISSSARFCRKRGRVVLVGVIGLNLNRADFYDKEISFQVSCSYGPGRYDSYYEEKGNDYPIGFVRWTEKRNFETILTFLANGRLNFSDLISNIVPLEDYSKIYGDLDNSSTIASIIKYSESNIPFERVISITGGRQFEPGKKIALIGAGNFVSSTLLTAINKNFPDVIKYIVSAHGLNAGVFAKKFNIPYASSDFDEILKDSDVGLVIIATRHNLHAQQTIKALQAGKNVFVEKPLALNPSELKEVVNAFEKNTKAGKITIITVGYNRRFSPFVKKMKAALRGFNGPLAINATMNAGHIPSDSWVHDSQEGGGRIIGEACHYMDLAVFLTGSPITSVNMFGIGEGADISTDTAVISLFHKNGSITALNYFSNGNKGYPKERIEVFAGNKTMILDNFKKLSFYGFKRKDYKNKQDKGHGDQFLILIDNYLKGGDEIIPIDEIVNVSSASFAAIESMKTGQRVEVEI